jgi:hypothetical protein
MARSPAEWAHIDRCDDLQRGDKVHYRLRTRVGPVEGEGTFVERVARPHKAVRYRVRYTIRTPALEKVRWRYRLLTFNQIIFPAT